MRKLLSILFIVLFSAVATIAQEKNSPVKTALLIIDIQNFYFPGDNGPGLVNAEQASLAAKEILQVFRNKKLEVIHVRHQSKKGFEIHKNVEPLPGEKVITKQEVCCFLGTDLHDYLNSLNINRLVIIGMQTQMCLEAAVRAAHDMGYECLVIQDACATRNLKFGGREVKAEDVQTSVLATINEGGYGKVLDLKTFKENPDKYLFQKTE